MVSPRANRKVKKTNLRCKITSKKTQKNNSRVFIVRLFLEVSWSSSVTSNSRLWRDDGSTGLWLWMVLSPFAALVDGSSRRSERSSWLLEEADDDDRASKSCSARRSDGVSSCKSSGSKLNDSMKRASGTYPEDSDEIGVISIGNSSSGTLDPGCDCERGCDSWSFWSSVVEKKNQN